MHVVRAPWTSGSFLLYTGALIVLAAAAGWLGDISDHHSDAAFAGWAAVFWALATLIALALLRQRRRVAAGLFAFVAVGLWGGMVGALFTWWGWIGDENSAFRGFHWGKLALELLVLLAALVALRVWRFPLIVIAAAGVSWFFVTDVVSNGGNWSAAVTLLVGLALLVVGLVLDSGDTRPYGFWVHVVAGLTAGGALVYWWHSSDAEWAGIIVAALVYIGFGALVRRSSYAVLGAVGLVAATGHYTAVAILPFTVEGDDETPSWQAPVGYLCLGLFLALLGMLLYGRRHAAEPAVPDAA